MCRHSRCRARRWRTVRADLDGADVAGGATVAVAVHRPREAALVDKVRALTARQPRCIDGWTVHSRHPTSGRPAVVRQWREAGIGDRDALATGGARVLEVVAAVVHG